jgi:glyoxylase-like metal-dependent hydrolase (beta-lactamase superfamily II)
MIRRLEAFLAVFLLAAALAGPASAQVSAPIRPDLGRLAPGKGAQLFNRALTAQREGDRTVVRLDARPGDGGALLDGVLMGEGVIEVDLRGKNVTQQSFLGIAFHVVDWTTYDAIYFRPFNFRAVGAEQRAHSVQYFSPPANTWQKLRTERPGQFEQAVEPPPDPDGWFHARIVVAKSKVEVYVNTATIPCLVVDDLGEAKNGGVALWVGNGSDGAFANLTITPTSPPGPPPESRQTIFQAAATGNVTRLQAIANADAGAVNARRPDGLTPLHMAAMYEQRQAAEFLVSKGTDVNAVARHSGTPLDVAYEAEDREFISWLESKGARATPLRFDVATLAPAIHRVTFPWGMMNNVLVFSGADGAVIVDSGFSARAVDELKKAVLRFSPQGIRFVVNSHPHGDHIAGNALAPTPAAVVSAATLATPPAGVSIAPRSEPLKGRSGRTLPAGYLWRTGGAEITIIPMPSLHSGTDLIVYFPRESVVAMGDLLLSESVPAVNDLAAYLSFLDDVLDVFPENTTFVSGHGRDLNASGVRAYRDSLLAMVAVVRTQLAAGRTAEQMAADDVLKAYKPKYSLLDFLSVDTLIPRAVAALQKGALK